MGTPLDNIDVITAKKNQFSACGINSVEELLEYIPRRYNDNSKITGILPEDQTSTLLVRVQDVTSRGCITANCLIIEGPSRFERVYVKWFNCPWMYTQARAYLAKDAVVAGHVRYDKVYKRYNILHPDIFGTIDSLGIHPVYKSIPGMSAAYLGEKIAAALQVGTVGSEMLPRDIVQAESLAPMPTALRYIHAPETMEQTEIGRDRIALNDLVYFSVNNLLNAQETTPNTELKLSSTELADKIKAALPYALTPDQESALSSMIANAREGRCINAMLQGDVGCGKTAVSMLLAAAFIGSGYQVALMAPTQVLAKQHLKTLNDSFEPFGINIVYLDSAMKAAERRAALKAIKDGSAQLIVGTHSCVGKDVEYSNLALAIIDEEHKFGVAQRAAIVNKAAAGVHCLNMSATPIPRSLATVVYGEAIQMYTIRTMPAGRKPVKTVIARDQNSIYNFVYKQIRKGHQAYVVCPAIEQSESSNITYTVEDVGAEYNRFFSSYGIETEMLTGRTTRARTEQIISRFESGETKILISTTVIEVGVNVPNATVMVIAEADRFGLSGLHQLRGRVGRGSDQSYCILQSYSQEPKALKRLETLRDTTDGFEIAEADLRLRGAGDIFGTQQSGENKYISLMIARPELYEQAVRVAKELIARGSDCCPLMTRITEERSQGVFPSC